MLENTGFFEKVYEVAKKIPSGRVTSYGAIAKAIGAPGSARMVGWAMNGAVSHDDVPAHRVLNRNGILTGKHHFPGTSLMQRMLEEEGIIVIEDQVQDFKQLFWDPVKELGFE